MESREIKFRAWLNYKNRFIYSHNYKNLSGFFKACEMHKKYGYDYTVQQYTCVKDKSGKEIYEGDILRGYKCQKPVIFESGAFTWYDEILGWEVYGNYDAEVSIEKDENIMLEVIGNIYENPELLKEQN